MSLILDMVPIRKEINNMVSKMLSVVVGTTECIASCPFCVSCTPMQAKRDNRSVNTRNFGIALKYADKCGVDTIVFTSRGEPLLYPEQITEYMKYISHSNANIPFIELQTNGLLIQKNKNLLSYLEQWYHLGMTHIALSVISEKDEINYLNYNIKSNLSETVEILHNIGFSVRLVSIMCKGDFYMDTIEKVRSFINYAKEHNVEQVTLRPVNEEFRRQSTHDWVEAHKFTDEDKRQFMDYLEKEGAVLMQLPRIGKIYDINGQNVMFSYPLNLNTRNADGETARQLIYFPDGHIRYEWEKEGGILL